MKRGVAADAAAERVVADFRARGWTLATAESCTGGLVAARITAVSGASDMFLGGVVAYHNRIKAALLGVPATVLETHGAVSAACAAAMAEGACRQTGADVAVSVTGIAGPGGGTPQKPVGLVFLGRCVQGNTQTEQQLFSGTREAVRRQAVERALAWALEALQARDA